MNPQAEAHYAPVYQFAEYRLDPARRSLTRDDGTPLNIAGKPFDVLLYLLRHAGDVVDRSALMQAVWPKRVVEENNINQVIAGLRRALGAEHIVTVAGRGYQFVTPVRAVGLEQVAEPPIRDLAPAPVGNRTLPIASKQLRFALGSVLVLVLGVAALGGWYSYKPRNAGGIAVLPCDDLGPDPTSAYFATGIHAELLNRLAQIRSLRVISRSSVMRYAADRPPNRQIASELGVDSIMECSVRKMGDELVFTAQLVDAATDGQVWAQSYPADTRDMRPVYAMQASVAVDVANALRVELLDESPARDERAPTESTEAYLSYRASFDEVDKSEQLRRVDRALELDPEFVDAWIRKSLTHEFMAGFETGEEFAADRAAAIAAARKAVELDPGSSLAHLALANELGQMGQWIESEKEWLVYVSLAHGAETGSNPFQKLAVGHADRAAAAMEEHLDTNPLDQGIRELLLLAYEILGRKEEHRAEWEYGERMWGSSWPSAAFKPPTWTAAIAHFDSPADGLARLRALHADPGMRSARDLSAMSTWALHFGDSALALEWFREGVELHATSMLGAWLPGSEPIRREPGFKDLVREQRLPEYWDQYGWPKKFCWRTKDDFECH